jgi:hypothetical protein
MICQHCGLRIRFIKRSDGKLLPVNEDALVTVVTKRGEVATGYIAHWQSCRYLQERDAKMKRQCVTAARPQTGVMPGVFEKRGGASTEALKDPEVEEIDGNDLYS